MGDEEKVVVTFKEIYNAMQDLTIEVRLLRQDYTNDKGIKDDHEKRIRALEAWKYGLPAALLMGAGSVILDFVMKG